MGLNVNPVFTCDQVQGAIIEDITYAEIQALMSAVVTRNSMNLSYASSIDNNGLALYHPFQKFPHEESTPSDISAFEPYVADDLRRTILDGGNGSIRVNFTRFIPVRIVFVSVCSTSNGCLDTRPRLKCVMLICLAIS